MLGGNNSAKNSEYLEHDSNKLFKGSKDTCITFDDLCKPSESAKSPLSHRNWEGVKRPQSRKSLMSALLAKVSPRLLFFGGLFFSSLLILMLIGRETTEEAE